MFFTHKTPLLNASNQVNGPPSQVWIFSLVHWKKYLGYLTGISKSLLPSGKHLSRQGALKKKKKKVQENKSAIRSLTEKVCLDLHNNAPTWIQTCHTSLHLTSVLKVGWMPTKSSVGKQAWGSGPPSNRWKILPKYLNVHI